MSVTRRSAASLLGALPFVGVMGRSASSGQGVNLAMASNYPANAQIGAAQGQLMPAEPLMPQWRAARLALNDPMVREIARSIAFAQHRHISGIEPDLNVYRSFSPMAKITFQRQRNVEREIAQMSTESPFENEGLLRKMIAKLMWGK